METQSVIVYRSIGEQRMDELLYSGNTIVYVLAAITFVVVYACLSSVFANRTPRKGESTKQIILMFASVVIIALMTKFFIVV